MSMIGSSYDIKVGLEAAGDKVERGLTEVSKSLNLVAEGLQAIARAIQNK